jgi:hypothetical protein
VVEHVSFSGIKQLTTAVECFDVLDTCQVLKKKQSVIHNKKNEKFITLAKTFDFYTEKIATA